MKPTKACNLVVILQCIESLQVQRVDLTLRTILANSDHE